MDSDCLDILITPLLLRLLFGHSVSVCVRGFYLCLLLVWGDHNRSVCLFLPSGFILSWIFPFPFSFWLRKLGWRNLHLVFGWSDDISSFFLASLYALLLTLESRQQKGISIFSRLCIFYVACWELSHFFFFCFSLPLLPPIILFSHRARNTSRCWSMIMQPVRKLWHAKILQAELLKEMWLALQSKKINLALSFFVM